LLGEGKGERGKEEVSSQGSGVLFLFLLVMYIFLSYPFYLSFSLLLFFSWGYGFLFGLSFPSFFFGVVLMLLWVFFWG